MLLVFSACAASLSTKAGDPDKAVALCAFRVCSSLDGLQSLIEQNMVVAPTWQGVNRGGEGG